MKRTTLSTPFFLLLMLIWSSFCSAEQVVLQNISTRGVIGVGESTLIGGFVLNKTNLSNGTPFVDRTVIIHGIGYWSNLNIPNSVNDPIITLRNSVGDIIASNDDCTVNTSGYSEIAAAGLLPPDELDSCIIIILPPGAYTVNVEATEFGLLNGVGQFAVYDVIDFE